MRVLTVLVFVVISSFALKAQPIPPDPPPPNPVPISGIEILLGAGALLGAKRFLNSQKPKP